MLSNDNSSYKIVDKKFFQTVHNDKDEIIIIHFLSKLND